VLYIWLASAPSYISHNMAQTPEPYAITQTLSSNPYTTLLTVITLGAAAPSTAAPPAATTSSPSAPDAKPDVYNHHGGLSAAQIGAILGTVVALSLIVLGGCICMLNKRRKRAMRHAHRQARHDSYYYYPSSRSSRSSKTSRSSRSKLPRKPEKVAQRVSVGSTYSSYRVSPMSSPRYSDVRHVRR
jgi:hypothetical protein